MNPSLSSINQNLLVTSDYFLIPTSPDYFSVMALDSLSTVLPRWTDWSRKAQTMQILTSATYPFPSVIPKFIGTIIQKFRPRGGIPAQGFQYWVDEIKSTVQQKLIPVLKQQGMLLAESTYAEAGISDDYCMAEIPDFNTLIAKSQSSRTPIYALTPKQIGHRGTILTNTLKSRDNFKAMFTELEKKIAVLTH
jgi:cellulose biosynthesis protein BcsQ